MQAEPLSGYPKKEGSGNQRKEDNSEKVRQEQKEQKSNLPAESLKAPRSAYIRFFTSNREKIKKEMPELAPNDLMVVAVRMWDDLPEEQKKPYREEEQREKERYEAARI